MADNFDDRLDDINDNLREVGGEMESLTDKAKKFLKTFTDPEVRSSLKNIRKSLQSQQNIAHSLSTISRENITSKETEKKLENAINKLKAEGHKLSTSKLSAENRIADLAKTIKDLQDKRNQAELAGNTKLEAKLFNQLQALNKTKLELQRKNQLTKDAIAQNDIMQEQVEELNKLKEEELKNQQKIGYHINKYKDNIKKQVLEATSLVAVFKFFKKVLLEVDESIVSLRKNLNLSGYEANNLYNNMAEAAASSNDTAISVGKLLKAQIALGEETGLYNARNTETLVTFSKLVDKIGITTKEASSLEMMSKLTGANFDQQRKSTAAIGVNLLRANGLNVKGSKILEQVANTTGQVAANLGNNPIEIAKAVAQAQLLGTTLEGVAKIANDLLNFESSISKELEAELLIGRDLNLERARALSLAGDQAGLAKELVNQVGTYSDFLSYNVIQQNQLAQAFGMSSDEMANMLKMQQYQNMNAEQLRAIGEEELARSMEQQTLQENFNNLVEKLQTLFINIANGPLGYMARAMSSILESSTAVYTIFGGITALVTGRLMAGLTRMLGINIANALANMTSLSAKTLGIGIPIAVGAVAAGYSYLKSQTNQAKQINDGVIDPQGGVVVSGPKGSIQLNKQDSIIAGTNLFDNPQPQTVVQPSITPQEMSNAIKEGMRGLQIVQEGVPMGQVMSKNIALHGDIPSSIA